MFNLIYDDFVKRGGVLKTKELNELGLSSRQISSLVSTGEIIRIKRGFYEHSAFTPTDELIIARLFPKAVIFLESALFHYGYIDRVPLAWQIAVDRNSEKSLYEIEYPQIKPFYLKSEYLKIGADKYMTDGVEVPIFNKERTIIDLLRYENKLDTEVFRTAIANYSMDSDKNLRRLLEYGNLFNINNKLQTYIGVWF
ncbi:MAG: type IV toxin-antitoxin system AbiEi family antitoxin domain-containing protein [Bacillota bacterium]|nr:type IV toxin-antitoxin system AbiEi family antitoxin domain-containing protein [Bacillota bacterium]HHU62214.1 hypothetical protein [Natronincola sp.]